MSLTFVVAGAVIRCALVTYNGAPSTLHISPHLWNAIYPTVSDRDRLGAVTPSAIVSVPSLADASGKVGSVTSPQVMTSLIGV